MKFINKHILTIYIIWALMVIAASIFKALNCPENTILILLIPVSMMAIGTLAGPAGSMIAGFLGTVMIYITF